jgi:hypothetical protein
MAFDQPDDEDKSKVCPYCPLFNSHNRACPGKTGDTVDMRFWQAGFKDGQAGSTTRFQAPSYLLGHHQGANRRILRREA